MIRTRQQGDTPFFPNMLNNGKVEVCLKEDVDKVIMEKDAKIASLKAQIAEAKELSILLQKRNKAIADNAIRNVESYKSKRDAEIESLKASHYAEMVDTGMRERRLKRALWLARAELCRRLDVDRYLRNHRNSWYNENCLTWAEACVAMEVKMCKAESKCRAKAEELK